MGFPHGSGNSPGGHSQAKHIVFDPFKPLDVASFLELREPQRTNGPARILLVVETCRRLSAPEKAAFELQRTRVERAHRHLLPSFSSAQRGPRHLSGADWDVDAF